MTRRCSHCSNNGHNSRTCPTRGGGATAGSSAGGVRLFGVRLTDGSFMKKSASMGNLSLYTSANPNPSSPSSDPIRDPVRVPDGYLSDDPNNASCSSNRRSDRKKGKPWSEEEHRRFLVGLQKLGKGDWRGIARNYVISRTPTQVASHAQKYFIRQSNATRRKRRSSLFDMVPDMVTEEPEAVLEDSLPDAPTESNEAESSSNNKNNNNNNNSNNPQPSLDLSLKTEAEPMEATSTNETKETVEESRPLLPGNLGPTTVPAFFLPIPPYPPFWAQSAFHPEEDHLGKGESSHHQVLKPTPILRKEPVNVDELVGMSRLNLSSETENGPQLSLNLIGTPSRQSAFHASGPSSNPELNEGKNSVIQAV